MNNFLCFFQGRKCRCVGVVRPSNITYCLSMAILEMYMTFVPIGLWAVLEWLSTIKKYLNS